jgi:hypothetical protein
MTNRLLVIAICLIGLPLCAQTLAPRDLSKIFIGRKEATWLPKVDGNTLPAQDSIEQKAKRLAARQRNLDAFALPVFPREPAPRKLDSKTPRLQRQAERITLNEALQTLQVNAINLRRAEFLVGGHEVGRGDTLVLGFKGVVFEAEVAEVGPQEIRFREKTSGETGVLPHRILPRFVPQPLDPKQATGLLQGLVRPMSPSR